MSTFPRWFDDFTTDPTSDPAYSFTGTVTYNGTFDRIEMDAIGEAVTLLNSTNSFGFLQVDAFIFVNNSTLVNKKNAIRAFGYWFVYHRDGVSVYAEDDTSWQASVTLPTASNLGFVSRTTSGRQTTSFIATPNGVDIAVGSSPVFSLPSRPVKLDLQIGQLTLADSDPMHVYSILLKADASLPKTATITQPAPGGALPAVNGPFIVDVPESRLYLDLGAYQGMSGISSVVWDPGSAKTGPVAMSENTGIPDRAGGTTGDFYLEAPVNGVSSDYRLVFKESFVTTNNVEVGDSVDFDILPFPATQNDTVVEEDDIQTIMQKDGANKFFRTSLLPYSESAVTPHNLGADGNVYSAAITSLLTDDRLVGSGQPVTEHNEATDGAVTFPMLVDLDLGAIRSVKSVYFHTDDDIADINYMQSCTAIYSKTTPFSGAATQGTLEASNVTPFTHVTSTDDVAIEDGLNFFPALDIQTRYLRLEFQSGDLISTDQRKILGQALIIQTVPLTIDSENDNAQFRHEPASGGGFVAYPAGGVSQGDGRIEITLPTEMEVQAGSDNDFFKISFKPDITD